jgi:predicted nuclease of predicted toxin-antitoxin system
LYTNENVELQIVEALRSIGHDVLTSLEAGNANRSIEDKDVLAFAIAQNRVLVTQPLNLRRTGIGSSSSLPYVRLRRRVCLHQPVHGVPCPPFGDLSGFA